MNIISISTDRNIFKEGSAVRARMVEYGSLSHELHIIVFAKKSLHLAPQHISPNVWIYPTQSPSKFFHMRKAVSVAEKIIMDKKWQEEKILLTAQDPFETGKAALRLKKKYGYPLQIQVHTDFLSPYFYGQSFLNKIRVRWARTVLLLAEEIRVVSKRIKDSLIREYHIPESKIDILPILSIT